MNISNLMKQAKEMQANLQKLEKELAVQEYTNESSNGVKCVMNGKFKLSSIEINSDLITTDNKEMLQDLIMIAVNEVVAKVEKEKSEKMNAYTGGMKIPGIN